MRTKDVVFGVKINSLTAIEFNHTNRHRKQCWLFLCDCGEYKVIVLDAVLSGNTVSCGCFIPSLKESRQKDRYQEKTQIFCRYRLGAKTRNLKFNITREELITLSQNPCYYCGKLHSNYMNIPNGHSEGWYYNGIDRVDNNKGYTLDNCVSCCQQCNQSKRDYSKDNFMKWIKQVYEYSNLEKEYND